MVASMLYDIFCPCPLYKNLLYNVSTVMIPHSVQGNPAVVAASPRNAGIRVVVGGANAPSTDDYFSS